MLAVFSYYVSSSGFNSPDTSISWTQQRHCYRIMRSASVIQSFPLPYPVNEAVHKAILHGIGWTESGQMLSSLSGEISLVRSNLSVLIKRGEDFIRCLAYPFSHNGSTNMVLISKINDLLSHFDSTATPIKVSSDLYDSLEVLYHPQQDIAKAALNTYQSHLGQSWHQVLIRHQPSALKPYGIDFNKWYGEPLQEKLKIWEEARSGVAAFNQESQRIKQIGYLIAEGKRILDQVATFLIREDAQCENDICRQERVQQWLWQAILGNPRIIEVWDDIAASIIDEEKSLPIDFTGELCDRAGYGT